MGGKGGGGQSGGGTSTSTTSSIPYDTKAIKEFLSLLEGQAAPGGTLASNPLPSQQVAPLNPTEQTGLAQTAATGAEGQGAADAALQEQQDTLSGDYLSIPQSYLDALNSQTTTEYENTIAPSEMSAAAQTGAFGGSADAEARALNQFGLSTSLANANAGVYEQERSNQLQAAQTLPALETGAGVPGEETLSAGGVEQQQEQTELNTEYQNEAQAAQWPYELLSFLGQGVTGIGGGDSTTTTAQSSPYAGSLGQSITGGVTSGLGALSTLALLSSLAL